MSGDSGNAVVTGRFMKKLRCFSHNITHIIARLTPSKSAKRAGGAEGLEINPVQTTQSSGTYLFPISLIISTLRKVVRESIVHSGE